MKLFKTQTVYKKRTVMKVSKDKTTNFPAVNSNGFCE